MFRKASWITKIMIKVIKLFCLVFISVGTIVLLHRFRLTLLNMFPSYVSAQRPLFLLDLEGLLCFFLSLVHSLCFTAGVAVRRAECWMKRALGLFERYLLCLSRNGNFHKFSRKNNFARFSLADVSVCVCVCVCV